MDKDTVLKIEGLGKKYIISHQVGDKQRSSHYVALRDVIAEKTGNIAKNILKPHKWFSRPSKEEFWALKDINLEVKRGDKVAIIGHNGAGKSTLLKILSRITEPTEGEIKIRGRVTSLLEVGTGFHPELTGRENIYLNGSVLGMTHTEINRKFDEIVAFAGVEKFLDTPVKRYSSGMRLRLGFAVAAHLESEILIIDEVLAVGDAEFQKKCLGKMDEISKTGERTILFVSHNMGAVQQLCNKGAVLQQGQVIFRGQVDKAIAAYGNIAKNAVQSAPVFMDKDEKIDITNVTRQENNKDGNDFEFSIDIISQYQENIENVKIDFYISNPGGYPIVHILSEAIGYSSHLSHGKNTFFVKIASPNLLPDDYYLTVYVYSDSHGILYHAKNIYVDTIPESMWSTKFPNFTKCHGIIAPLYTLERVNNA